MKREKKKIRETELGEHTREEERHKNETRKSPLWQTPAVTGEGAPVPSPGTPVEPTPGGYYRPPTPFGVSRFKLSKRNNLGSGKEGTTGASRRDETRLSLRVVRREISKSSIFSEGNRQSLIPARLDIKPRSRRHVIFIIILDRYLE